MRIAWREVIVSGRPSALSLSRRTGAARPTAAGRRRTLAGTLAGLCAAVRLGLALTAPGALVPVESTAVLFVRSSWDEVRTLRLFVASSGPARVRIEISEPAERGQADRLQDLGIAPGAGWRDLGPPAARGTGHRGRLCRVVVRVLQGEGLHLALSASEAGGGFLPQAVIDGKAIASEVALEAVGTLRPFGRRHHCFLVGVPPGLSPGRVSGVADTIRQSGIGVDRCEFLWEWVQPNSPTEFDFRRTDRMLSYSHDTLGCDILGLLCYSAPWARTSPEPGTGCPPRGLFADVSSDSNYWARYVEAVVRRYGDRVVRWEVWNEPNHMDRFWRTPADRWYGRALGLRPMCSLYVRLCRVAVEVIRGIQDTALVFVGSVSQVDVANPGIGLVSGFDWLAEMYSISPRPFWDGVTVHPYQSGLQVDAYRERADRVRRLMLGRGDPGELVASEVGWGVPAHGRRGQADNLGRLLVASEALRGDLFGGYDETYWYSLLERGDGFGILDGTQSPRPAWFASRFCALALRGMRYTGESVEGGAQWSRAHGYCFSGPGTERLWVTWRDTGIPGDPGPSWLDVPLQSDAARVVPLPYGDAGEGDEVRVPSSGLLRVTTSQRPTFIWEVGAADRPDLVIDSLVWRRTGPGATSLAIDAWVRNRGTGATPRGFRTEVAFSLDGVDRAIGARSAPLGVGDVYRCQAVVPLAQVMPSTMLVEAEVNPGRRFVELVLDNNSCYAIVESKSTEP